jgi:hypothetical protein
MVERPLNSILLILAIVGSLGAQAPGKGVKDPMGSIVGRVMIGPDPASGVKVLLNPQSYGRSKPPVAKGTADSDGIYLLTGVPAGNYRITVLDPGYVSPKVATGGRGEPLSLTDGEKLSNVDFALTRGGAITGQVTDSDGQPVIQEEVILCPVGEAYPQGSSIRRVFAGRTHSKQYASL